MRGCRLARALVLCALAGQPGCRSEAESRAHRLRALRSDAQDAVAALDAFCAAREAALDSIAGGTAGWEPALEELLRATDDVDDYCEGAGQSHDHAVEGSRGAPADTAGGR
jgi:hypothetical protein